MSYKLSDVKHETNTHFVLRVKTGHEVYKIGVTHATRCAQIGFSKDMNYSLGRAIAECDRRTKESI